MLHVGEHYLDDVQADIVFRTPGMHPDIPALRRLREKGAELTSEMEAFFEVCPCPIIGVTGSDGKTTTTTLISEMLKAEGKTVYLSGDTLYHRAIPEFLQEESIDLALLCINGFGNNMNARDAARLAQVLQPKLVIPVHWDMFAPFGANPQDFVSALQNVQAKILNAYEALEL